MRAYRNLEGSGATVHSNLAGAGSLANAAKAAIAAPVMRVNHLMVCQIKAAPLVRQDASELRQFCFNPLAYCAKSRAVIRN